GADALSPPLLVPIEKALRSLLRAAEGLDPVLEQAQAVLGERIAALRRAGRAGIPFRGDDALLLEGAQQAVEVAHLHPRLACQLRQALEQVVPVRRLLAQEQEERGLREALDAREHAPAPAVVPAGARPSHTRRASRCKTHM